MGNSTRKAADMSTKRYSSQQCTRIRRESKPARKIVLLGKTGDGKSSSGNTILNKETFTTESSPESVTAGCQTGVEMVGGRSVTVIDTPGFFDTRLDEEFIKSQIIRCIIECAPAVDALVIVLKVERYTRQEMEILDKIVEYCGENTYKHAVILFTHGEDLNGQTIEEFVKKSSKLQELVNKCGGRCHVIDNEHWNDCHLGYRSNKVHMKKLMETIDMMVKKNDCYTNELMSHVEEDIQEVMHSMDTINLCPEEKREAVKKIVYKKYLIRCAGVTTGTLIGAFMGIGVALGSVVALLRTVILTKAFKTLATTATSTATAVNTLADKAAAAASATGAAAVAGTGAAAVAGVVEAGIVTGAAATAGAGAVEAGVAAGAGIGAAAGTGIAAGVIFGAAALAGAVGGGITGYKAAEEADSVLDAIKISAKVNYKNAKEVVRKAEELPSNVYKKLQ